MKLQLLDINQFIEKNKLKQVTTVKLYEKPGKTDPSGLFSEEIFGRFGSVDRRKTFAFVDLRCSVIHPEVYYIIVGLDTAIAKLITEKAKYTLSQDGSLIEDPKGSCGVPFFISIFDKINLDKFKKNKAKNVVFLKANRKKIFIDKYLILPAGIRDLAISKTSRQTIVNFSDLSELYATLIRQVNMLDANMPDDIKFPIINQVQRTVLEINTWIKNRMKGRQGIIRGGLLKKVTDYSGRLVATTDHTLLLGTVGLPWQVVLKLYEPFAINYILKKDASAIGLIQQVLKTEQTPDINDLKRLFTNLINKPDLIPVQLKEYLVHVAEEIVADKVVIYKRDPVENKDSWLAADVRVDREGMTMKLNPLDLPRTGGDHDGDAYAVFALFTKEAQEEARSKMHPRYTESMWSSVVSADKCPYQITLDAATTIYAATKR